MLATVDYISFAHNEAKKSVPLGLKELWIRGLNTARSLFISKKTVKPNTRKNFIERLLNKLLSDISNDFVSINLEFQAIHDKLINGELVIENPKDDFHTVQKIIKLLTRADNLFIEIDYFGNETLKTELKSALHTTYLIEVELKALMYKNKRSDYTKDELFLALSVKSKQTLAKTI